MAAQAKLFGNFFLNSCLKKVDLVNDSIKAALMANTFVPNQDTQQWWSDVSAQEVTGTGYTAGGLVLTSKSWTYSAKTSSLTAANLGWAASTITAYYLVLYDFQTGVASTSPLIGWVDFGGAQTSSSSNFPINWQAGGIIQLTVL